MLRKVSLVILLCAFASCTVINSRLEPEKVASYSTEDVFTLLRELRRVDPFQKAMHGGDQEANRELLLAEANKRLQYVTEPDKTNILNGRVSLGMSSTHVLWSWGQPDKVNRSLYSSGVREQWIWRGDGRFSLPRQILYIENGRVTSVHQ